MNFLNKCYDRFDLLHIRIGNLDLCGHYKNEEREREVDASMGDGSGI